MVDNNTPPANAIMGFASWLTCRKEVAGPFSECHDAAPMAQLVEEYCEMYGLTYDDTYSYRDAERERRAKVAEPEPEPDDTTGEKQDGMSEEAHIAWFFHDVMNSWAGREVWVAYAKACHEFQPYKEQLPPKFRAAWLRLVAIWADR